jgi:hypothetical protein
LQVRPSASASAAAFTPTDVDPAATVTKAYRTLAETSYRFQTDQTGGRSTGFADFPHQRHEKTTTGVIIGTVQRRTIGTDVYVQGLDEPEDKWIHFSTTKAGPNSLYRAQQPPNDYLAFVDVRQVGPDRYQATADPAAAVALLSGATPSPRASADPSTLLSVTVVLDGSGRLAEVDVSGNSGFVPTIKTRYFDYGATVEVTKPPASETVEAPASLY